MAKILNFISDAATSALVSRWLKQGGHQVLDAGDPAGLGQAWDLALGDAPGWAWAGPGLLARKQASYPAFLPVVLLRQPGPDDLARPQDGPAGVDECLTLAQGRAGLLALLNQILALRSRFQESMRGYSMVSEAMPVAVFLVRAGAIVHTNPSFHDLTGLAPGRERDLSIPEIFHPNDHKKLARCISGALDGSPQVYAAEVRLHPDLGGHWVEAKFCHAGEVGSDSIVAALQDINQRRQTQANLRNSERRYRRLLDGMLEGCQVIAPDLTYVYVNQAAAGQGRQKVKAMVGRKMTKVYPNLERDNPLLLAKIRQCLERREAERFDSEFIFPDGSRGWFELSLRPVPEGVFILSMDITAREKAEREVRESESKYRSLFDAMGQGGVYHDHTGAVIDANPAAQSILGLSLDEMRGRTPLDLPWRTIREDGSQYPSYEHPSILALMSGEAVRDRVMGVYNQREKAYRWIKVTAVPQCEAGGGVPVRVFTTFADITELKQVEESLRASDQRFRTLFNAAADAIFILDENGHFIEVNDVACQRLGYERAELLGQTPAMIAGPDSRHLVRARLDQVQGQGQAIFEAQHKRRDGSLFPVEISSRTLNLDGRPVILAMARDTSERKAAHLALVRAQKMEAIGQLAAGIAHEINTPTQYIYTNVEFLKQAFQDLVGLLDRVDQAMNAEVGGLAPGALRALWAQGCEEIGYADLGRDVSEALAACLDGLGRVKAIVDSMRYFSHPGTGEKKAVDVNRILENAVVVSKNAWKYHATLETDLALDLPQTPAYEGDLSQAVLNIIINAAQALQEAYGHSQAVVGRIVVRSRREGDWVTISIGDNGPGIPPEVRHSVFDPFFTTKEVGKGTGQGLAIAHSAIVDKHGGSLSFETEVGQGTTFFVRLPLIKARATT
ncbi:MAG: PAS domain S-box protein [Pseudomonadota bacterium]